MICGKSLGRGMCMALANVCLDVSVASARRCFLRISRGIATFWLKMSLGSESGCRFFSKFCWSEPTMKNEMTREVSPPEQRSLELPTHGMLALFSPT